MCQRFARFLIASPLGDVIAAPMNAAFPDATITVARDETEFRSEHRRAGAVRRGDRRPRVQPSRPRMEVRWARRDRRPQSGRPARPVLIATQGHSMENDHLAEGPPAARCVGGDRPERSDSPHSPTPWANSHSARPCRCTRRSTTSRRCSSHFDGRRGITAGLLAGAIASGNAADNATLAAAAKVSPNTANKVATNYLGPIIRARGRLRRPPATDPAVGVPLVRTARPVHRELVPAQRALRRARGAKCDAPGRPLAVCTVAA